MEYIMNTKFTLDDINEHLAMRIERQMLEDIKKKEEERKLKEKYPLYREKQLQKYKKDVNDFTSKLDVFYEKLHKIFDVEAYESIQQRSADDAIQICRFPEIITERYVLSVDRECSTVNDFLGVYDDLCRISTSFWRMSEIFHDILVNIVIKTEGDEGEYNILAGELSENNDDIFYDFETYIKLREEMSMESIINKRFPDGYCLKEYIRKSMEEHGFFAYVPYGENYIYILSASVPLLFEESIL